MISGNVAAAVAAFYVIFLFVIASMAERRAARGELRWLRSPIIYTLSISVYCTAWTFYGAVGSAARGGLAFMPIYLGPTLVFVGWIWLLRRMVRIGRANRITSIADMISSRYGKSRSVGVAVTVLAVVGTTPYIALQLQSMSLSFEVLTDAGTRAADDIAFWLAAGLAAFTILFGTRNVDVNERHYGVVTAIAVEAVVKLFALLAVGIFVVFGVAGGAGEMLARIPDAMVARPETFGAGWAAQLFLAGTAILCLPRMFQVIVVENVDERHLATASWAFPLYLFLICLFVVPIAATGLSLMPEGANPDLFVLTVPLALGQEELALIAFLGGFSAATSMVIVAAIALSTMVSNHIVLPLWLRATAGRTEAAGAEGGDVRQVLLNSRRAAIAGILFLGYVYYQLTGGSTALASIGLIAFAGVAQLLPPLVGGLFWRGATRTGALLGLGAGALVWAYTLFLPSFEGGFLLSSATLSDGLWGIGALRPQALFGLEADPVAHAVFWSMLANVLGFVLGSLFSTPGELERLQGEVFIDADRLGPAGPGALLDRSATSEDLFALATRILGQTRAEALFGAMARMQGKAGGLPDPTLELIQRLETELAGSVGGASAHEMVSQIAGGGTVSVEALMKIADETAEIVEYSRRLEEKSAELEATATQLRRANAQLVEIGAQKDAFLSQVSHELRTPMTSIRSFSEILQGEDDLPPEQGRRFATIIHDESRRLTRLLDEILDLSILESGRVSMERRALDLDAVLDRALASTEALTRDAGLRVARSGTRGLQIEADEDRLAQVFINLISNVVKYGCGEDPELRIAVSGGAGAVHVDVADNGPGIPEDQRERIFEKFARASAATLAGSAGLGLPISREIMRNLGGDLTLRPGGAGAAFRVTIPAPGGAQAP
ncbi:MAG: ATP-binding protein [Pseudomonadota bacterium]